MAFRNAAIRRSGTPACGSRRLDQLVIGGDHRLFETRVHEVLLVGALASLRSFLVGEGLPVAFSIAAASRSSLAISCRFDIRPKRTCDRFFTHSK